MPLGEYELDLRSLAPNELEAIVESALKVTTSMAEDLVAKAAYGDVILELGLDHRDLLFITFYGRTLIDLQNRVYDPKIREIICENHDWISRFHEQYDSVEDIKRRMGASGERLITFIEAFNVQIRLWFLLLNIYRLPIVLFQRGWLELAKTPRQFNKELSHILRVVKRTLKKLYGVPSHRSQVNADRDRKLWLLKRTKPKLSWGQLGRKLQITDGAAELAYKRQVQRERSRLKSFQQGTDALYKLYTEGGQDWFKSLEIKPGRLSYYPRNSSK